MEKLSLEQKIQASESAFDMLYNNESPVLFTFPLAPEFSNWRDEQIAWKDTAIFQDMSFHMFELVISGPDSTRLLSHLGINSFKGFGPMQAKQFVACNHDGYVIGDGILICEIENEIRILGRPGVMNWVMFHVETGDFDVTIKYMDTPTPQLSDRHSYRYQVQGPNADKILETLNGGSLPDIPFFKMGRFSVAGHPVVALNHRMSGAPGYEFWGPSTEGEAVKAALLEMGKEYGLTQIGGAIYPVTATVSGWFSALLPAIYTGEKMKPYREWLSAAAPESGAALGGSCNTGRLDDLYATPYDLGYGFMVKFDHTFIGREALEVISSRSARKKVRLNWDTEDVLDIHGSMLREGENYLYLQAPSAMYATYVFDEVMNNGKRVGISLPPAYSCADKGWISLAMIDEDLAVDEQRLTLTWGEPNGGSAKPSVERHVQKTVRVTVEAKPVKRY